MYARIFIAVGAAITVAALYFLLASVPSPEPPVDEPFPNELEVQFLEDGRSARLLKDYVFEDSQGRTWTTPAGYVSDGASIPKVVWGITGGPFSGKYRKAAIIHDQYCDVRTRPWRQVHRVFYDAMIASGVDERKAAIMYLAVYRFGPRWDDSYTVPCSPDMNCVEPPEIEISFVDPTIGLEKNPEEGNRTLKLIENFVDQELEMGTLDIDSSFNELLRAFDEAVVTDYLDHQGSKLSLSREECEEMAQRGYSLTDIARVCGQTHKATDGE